MHMTGRLVERDNNRHAAMMGMIGRAFHSRLHHLVNSHT